MMLDYGSIQGTCNVPQQWTVNLPDGNEVNLGKWLNSQRATRDSTLTEAHKALLQRLVDNGMFQWNWRDIWERHFGRLLVYGARTGTCNVPAEWTESLPNWKVHLGRWLVHQRQSRDTFMTEEHKTKLQRLVDTGMLRWNMDVPQGQK